MIEARYVKIQLKRALKSLPYIALYWVLITTIILVLCKACVKILGNEGLTGKIRIGIVLPEDDKTADFAVSLVTSMDSVSSMCQFQYTDEKAGREALEKQEIFALVLIPEHLLEDILVGINTPVTILSMEQKGVEVELFHEFARMGIDMLGYAQMGVYTVDAYCAEKEELKAMAQKINWEINEYYIKYTFSRLALFEEKEISATGDFSFVIYYACAGFVLLSMLMGIPLAFYFDRHNDAFLQVCKARGLYAVKRIALTYGAISILGITAVTTAFFLIKTGNFLNAESAINPSFSFWLASVLVCESVLAFIQFVYQIAQEKVYGILILFFGSIGMLFISGGLVPLAFLPKSFQMLSAGMPTTYWIKLLGMGICGETAWGEMARGILITIIFLSLSCYIEKYKEYK